jgi:hypothetical protein
MGRGLGSSEEVWHYNPIWVVIHICVEITQGISLYSYLYLKLVKTPCFSYYLLCFLFYKIGEQEGGMEEVLPGDVRGGRRFQMYTCYLHVYTCK